MQTSIPCTMMRGGTSRGPYFLANDLPRDWETQKQVLLSAMGSCTGQQIDGIGGATSLTSKAAIISVSDSPEADIDYLFAQVSIDDMSVDTAPSCGNILSGAAPFAIESGLVRAQLGETLVRVRNLNTNSFIHVLVQTPDGFVNYEGETQIDGVEGSAAPVMLNFLNVAGTKTGKLFPTGQLKDSILGTEVSCIDAAMPMVLIPATSLGIKGNESKQTLDNNESLLGRIEEIRLIAGEKMGLGDVSHQVIPKVGLLSSPQQGGSITSRYFVPHNCHASHSATGAICVSVCSAIPGTVAEGLTPIELDNQVNSKGSDKAKQVVIEHPSGKITIALNMTLNQERSEIHQAGLVRTARRLFRGDLYVPSRIWTPLKLQAS